MAWIESPINANQMAKHTENHLKNVMETESLKDTEGLGIRLNNAWRKALGFWRVLGFYAQELRVLGLRIGNSDFGKVNPKTSTLNPKP